MQFSQMSPIFKKNDNLIIELYTCKCSLICMESNWKGNVKKSGGIYERQNVIFINML